MLAKNEPTIGFLMHDIARTIRHRFDARARAIGATRQQWRVLLVVAHNEGLTQAELAELVDVERITACRMVDRLTEAGLLERRADPADRRVWRLHLLAPAYGIVEQLTAISREIEDEVKRHLGADIQQFVGKLLDLRDGLREPSRDSGRRSAA